MDPLTRDDLLHAIDQTMAFYGKSLDKVSSSFWLNAIRDKDPADIKRALVDYTKQGKHAPKPVDILGLISVRGDRRKSMLPAPDKTTTNCPPEIANAWLWFINRISEGTAMEGLFKDQGPVDIKTQERYLHIVNHEAHMWGLPEAIPDEFKLPEVWGGAA